ncbi:hypothetical protein CCMA1212_005244 [Trichoderma ghanense]|uniref:Uncharacterized protein n=1 Tax=Trichoderma ghanense TaxID=65468 RepID=A0ABY2H486_9HYPO
MQLPGPSSVEASHSIEMANKARHRAKGDGCVFGCRLSPLGHVNSPSNSIHKQSLWLLADQFSANPSRAKVGSRSRWPLSSIREMQRLGCLMNPSESRGRRCSRRVTDRRIHIRV